MCKIKVFLSQREIQRGERESIEEEGEGASASQVIIEPPNKLIAFTLFFGIKFYSCLGISVLQSSTKSYFFLSS
jgi:hypothetical protein